MLATLAIAAGTAAHQGGGTGSILALILSLIVLGIVVPPTAFNGTTALKNSGILRYTFGGNASVRTPQFDAIPGQNTPSGSDGTLIQCLGFSLAVTVDSDNHLFGVCPGHRAIVGAAGTLFSGNDVNQADMEPVAKRVLGVNNFYDQYIPAGTKVHAYFIITNAVLGASTVVAEAPAPIVQTEVVQGRRWRNGVEDPSGEQFLASIRVAIKNVGSSTQKMAGVLVVELQHSTHDIPGGADQDATFSASSID
jgi:hypothetical protein